MANVAKESFLSELINRVGAIHKFGSSQSLYEAVDGSLRFYIRYSKRHSRGTFYGLRLVDLKLLEGHPSFLCFLTDRSNEPLLIPFAEFEEVFRSITPADDGQFKAQVFATSGITELYIAKAGKFNVESYLGWASLETLIDSSSIKTPVLSHTQVQTLLGAIGCRKGYDIWIPTADRSKLDWSLVKSFKCEDTLPLSLNTIKRVVEEIDVIWMQRGSGSPKAFFEVEHSTPIYSGLLRFNHVYLIAPNLSISYSVVSNEERRSTFVQQLSRPTFLTSGLNAICNFLEYGNVFSWHERLRRIEK
ncbi:MAG: hypothetical protein ACREOO_26985 [bacterium]